MGSCVKDILNKIIRQYAKNIETYFKMGPCVKSEERKKIGLKDVQLLYHLKCSSNINYISLDMLLRIEWNHLQNRSADASSSKTFCQFYFYDIE